MPRRKLVGWPKLMVAKRLKGGRTGYNWAPPTWAWKAGCPIGREALGTDYATAKERCDELLNPQFDAWRRRGDLDGLSRPVTGSFDWMVHIYKSSPKFQRLPSGTKRDYDRALHLVSNHVLKDKRLFGALPLKSITPGAADRLHQRIVDGGKGGRVRTAKLCMDVCRRAWRIAYREKPAIVPADNPFARMGISYRANITRAATYDETMRFVSNADELGNRSIGTAALIGFFLLQRAEDIFSRLAWSHYRPSDAPDIIRALHHKTGEAVDVPLFDEDGSELFPELIARLEREPRRGSLIIMRDEQDARRKIHLP